MSLSLEDITNWTPDEITIASIYEALQEYEDIILEIDSMSEQQLRKGLSNHKAKQTQKLKEAGLPIDNMSLGFRVLDKQVTTDGAITKIQVWLKPKEAIFVRGIKISEENPL